MCIYVIHRIVLGIDIVTYTWQSAAFHSLLGFNFRGVVILIVAARLALRVRDKQCVVEHSKQTSVPMLGS
jgi:hypothetical protein